MVDLKIKAVPYVNVGSAELALKLDKANPTFTGTLTGPTVAGGALSDSTLTLKSTTLRGSGQGDSIAFITGNSSNYSHNNALYIDTDGRISNGPFTTYWPPTAHSVTNGSGYNQNPWWMGQVGQQGDGKIGFVSHKINTATTSTSNTYLYNQVTSLVFAQGNVWSVGFFGYAYSVDTGGTQDSHAWCFAGQTAIWGNLKSYGRVAEFKLTAGGGGAGAGDYTAAWAVDIGASGAASGYHPTGYMYLSNTVAGGEPQQGIVWYDITNPVKSTGALMTTWANAFSTTPTLSCAYGFDFRRSTFSTAFLTYGTASDGTILFSVNGSGDILGQDLTVEGATVMMAALPTSDPAVAGQVWSNSGVLTLSAG